MVKLNYPNFWQHRSWISYLLLPFSGIYFLGGLLRRLLAKSHKLPAPVICIGNSTIGGTGKTQVAIWLATQFKERKTTFVILCKGYGGRYREPTIVISGMSPDIVGDEALELCEHGTTIVARNPIDAIPLLQKLAPDVIIVDDGMQNPHFIKDYILLVVDGMRGFGNRFLFPAGPMRQSVESGLEMADSVVLISSSHLPLSFPRRREFSQINSPLDSNINNDFVKLDPRLRGDDRVKQATITPTSKLDLTQKYLAFAGIGNPDRFFNSAKASGLDIVATKVFGDHHKYSEADIALLKTTADEIGAKLLTTRKDYVKLKKHPGIIPFDVRLEIDKEKELIDKIYAKILPHS